MEKTIESRRNIAAGKTLAVTAALSAATGGIPKKPELPVWSWPITVEHAPHGTRDPKKKLRANRKHARKMKRGY
ncbi:hypothetical protein DRN75_00850 [Nanoarchaeota archaeon]|nr:MAG: hypothetical protein DRN75_00850 [Nanoarchaeota archaeon]